MLKWTKQQQNLQEQTLTAFQISVESERIPNFTSRQNRLEYLKQAQQIRKRYSTGNFLENNNKSSNNIQQKTTIKTKKNMPTATNLERRLHRRSVDNYLDAGLPRRLPRHSLNSNENKENFGIHFMRSPLRDTSQIALRDVSNGKNPRRLTLDTIPQQNGQSPRRRMPVGRFSDDFIVNDDDDETTPLSHFRFRNAALREESSSLSSSRMGDVTLDRMLDAIIQSAQKEIKTSSTKGKNKIEQTSKIPQMTKTAAGETTLYSDEDEEREASIHEMEVRTPTHLKRQRVVRRKNRNKQSDRKVNSKKQQEAEPKPQPTLQQQTMIGLTLPNGIPSPETPIFKRTTTNEMALLAAMETPQDLMFIVDHHHQHQHPHGNHREAGVGMDFENCISNELQQQRCSTPALEEVQSIKRCLSFSSSTTDEDDADFSAAKRSSVASSNASSTDGNYYYYGPINLPKTSDNVAGAVKGAIDLSIFLERKTLNVHVIRCRDLQRTNGSTALNAYVKVALIRKPNVNKSDIHHHFQRTAVHRHSSRPYFDHRFKFHLGNQNLYGLLDEHNDDYKQRAYQVTSLENFDADFEERLQLAVWHRDRQLKRSEFLGCLSFPLQTLLQQPINGSYKLQSQACLNKPQAAFPLQAQQQQQHQSSSNITSTGPSTLTTTSIQNNSHHHPQQQHQLEINNQKTTISAPFDSFVATASIAPQQQHNEQLNNKQQKSEIVAMATTLGRQKSNDDGDGISIDSTMAQTMVGANAGNGNAGGNEPMVLSKKALHQRDADENLFLRFLELDPPSDETAGANTAATAATNTSTSKSLKGDDKDKNASSARRLSAAGRPIGRTPFTMTKKLTRTAERGFGFSIVWTHPPRVEKIEPGLSADRCGILPGDYVIFVDKHNVVTMPEADVLNLIRSQGSTLTLEIFRRSGSGGGGVGGGSSIGVPPALSIASRSHIMNGKTSRVTSAASNYASDEQQSTATTAAVGTIAQIATRRASAVLGSNIAIGTQTVQQPRPSTACSGTSSVEAAKRRLNLPQVTFSKESIVPITDNRRRFLLQLISREQNFISAIHFGIQRFVQPLSERKDLISPNDHRTLFQNIDELLRISEDILEQLCQDDQEPQMNFASRVYLSKTTAICAAYKKYCNGIKRADCVLVNKSRQTGSDFIAFITEPQVPRKRPDLTMFIHRPLQHFREILKLMQLLASNCHVDTEEHKNFTSVISELQAAYREITVSSGLMEPLGEGRPLLTLQDLESRMVFTKCKPFTLAVQGRQWIFGGDLSRVEGRSIKPYWTLLFSDIIVFAKVSRDRVLFITEEPIPIANVVDSCFHMRKKTTEFRLTVDPNGRLAESPTGYCAPDLTRTPKKSARRKSLVLRAPSLELKAVWQNLLQRQIFLVNAALGSTPLSSPLDSPDVLNTLVPLSDIGIAGASIGSIKLPSMDSINMRNQQQQNKRLSNTSEQIEMLIDEKCRILNKTGTPKSSALHLANWMKGQLDKQQEQARLAAERTRENITPEEEHLLYPDSDQDERITYWTRQQLEKRTKELNLAKEHGTLSVKSNFNGKRLSGVEELSMSEVSVSQMSKSHSTTSDSQITVRSSPIVLDKLAVCRHCHKNCQQHSARHEQHISTSSATRAGETGALVCNSLKVQHSQNSPNRCCKLNGNAKSNGSRAGSTSSISSSTITGEQPSELSSKVVASLSRPETTGDTESDVAQLLTDDISQSEATTDDSVGAIPSSSSGIEDACRKITNSISKLRILDQRQEARALDGSLMNGHWSGSSGGESDKRGSSKSKQKPEPPPRNLVRPKEEEATISSQQETKIEKVKTTVTITETAKIIKNTDDKDLHTQKTPTTRSPKSSRTPASKKSATSVSPSKFIPCNCKCTAADFEHTTLSPDECEHQTCKLIESPKQSPKMPRQITDSSTMKASNNSHENCRCVCGNREPTKNTEADDEDLSLMLIGLAQFTPAAKLLNFKTTPTAPLPTPTSTASQQLVGESSFVPTIAVVPPTPDAVLTKTSTHVWDNSGTHMTTSTTTKIHINNTPKQAVIEHIPEDSCDESPLDEEPPYRPMSNALRRYGTMSSLEKLPSDDRLDGEELEELDDDEEIANDDDHDDRARADNVTNDNIQIVTKVLYETDETSASASDAGITPGAWTSRAGSFVSGKMSFFEESRAFIDKYLGRWNQEQATGSGVPAATSDPDEQLDECTSGGTSGEDVWGTPTSGGENDEMHLVNSENTHSSPTKSSTSLNDDDDTELMMDELLMAPPMSASTIRGLLPRRRLEPLFEEETESDEEKTQQESEDLKKGETTTNGHDLEDSVGSSSDEKNSSEEDEPTSTTDEDRLQPNLQTTISGPRPLRGPTSTMISTLPASVLMASSCEYLLEQRSVVVSQASNSFNSSSPAVRTTFSDSKASTSTMVTTTTASVAALAPAPKRMLTTTTTTKTTTMMSKHSTMSGKSNDAQQTVTTTMTTTTITTKMPRSRAPSSTSTTISNVSANISKDSSNVCSSSNKPNKPRSNVVRPAKFIPPPPPPRRLLLTQTNLMETKSGNTPPKAPHPQRKSGAFADSYSSVDADDEDFELGDGIHYSSNSSSGVPLNLTTSATESDPKSETQTSMKMSTMTSLMMKTKTSNNYNNTTPLMDNEKTKAAYSTKNFTSNTGQVENVGKRSSSTIIETSLLGSVAQQKPTSTSSTIVSMTKDQQQQMIRLQVEQDEVKLMKTAKDEQTKMDAAVLAAVTGSSLSPRLEMRLALNHDILGDEDLICYNPAADLTTILGHDLSTFHRLTGRDLLNRSAMNRVQPKEAVISFSQQRNSKMDTPTLNRRRQNQQQQQHQLVTTSLGRSVGSMRAIGVAPQHPPPNRNTWSNSAYVDQSEDGSVSGADNSKNFSYSSDESKLSDLEILARREKIFCMSQSKSGSQARTTMTTTTTTTMTTKSSDSSNNHPMSQLTRTTSTTSMGVPEMKPSTEFGERTRKIGRDETALMETGKGNRLMSFLKRRNSERPVSPNCSQSSLNDSLASGTPTHRQQQLDMSPSRKDNDKPSLNRRLWKHLTKRRRANSISEIAAS